MTTALLLFALGSAALTEPVASLAAPADASAPAAVASAATGTAVLTWSGPVQLQVEQAPEEIVVRFDRPLAEDAIAAFASAAGADLADFRWNDSSLVLRPAVGRRINAIVVDRRLEVEFRSDDEVSAGAAPTPVDGAGDPAIELALLKAQADAAAGFTGQARRALASLEKRYPDAEQVQRALADVELADGAVLSAAERYRALAADDPAALRAIAEASGSLTSALTVRSAKTFNQKEGSVFQSSLPIGDGLTLGAGIRHVMTRSDIVSAPPGEPTTVDSKLTIADVTAGLALGPTTRLLLQGSALVDPGLVGAGARLLLGSQERQLRLGLAYRLPDLSTVEQAAFGGHVSRATLGGSLRLTPELAGQADLSWSGYGLAGEGILTRTIGATAGLDYLVRRGSPSLALNYRLDGEYARSSLLRPGGLAYIPLADRENHSVQLVSSLPLRSVQLTGAFGWTKDRIGGGNGPSANLGGIARIGSLWSLEANGGISSVSRPAVSGQQLYMRLSLSRNLKKRR